MMPLDLGTLRRALSGWRGASLTALAVTVLGLGVSAALLVPDALTDLLAHGPAAFRDERAPAWHVLPLLTGLAGLVTAALCLRVGADNVRPIANPRREAEQDLSRLAGELRTLLAHERQELGTLHETCEAASRESMAVGARLAGFVLDAETQLKAGVEQARQALIQPTSELARAADLVVRLEQVVPGIVQASQRETPSASAIAALERTLGSAVAGAVAQVTALTDASAALRRDAAVLDKAGRELAMAGAHAVTRVSEAAVHVEAVAATLPAASETLVSAAERALESLGEASAVLCADSAALDAAMHDTARVAAVVEQGAACLHETGESLIGRMATMGRALEAGLGSLPAVTEHLDTQIGQIAQHAETLVQASERTAEAGQASAVSLRRAEAMLAELPDLAGTLATAAERLNDRAGVLRSASDRIAEAGDAAAMRIDASAGPILSALPDANAVVREASAELRQQADALTERTSRLAALGQDTLQAIAAEAGRGEAAGRNLTEVSAALQARAEALAQATAVIGDAVGAGTQASGVLNRAETVLGAVQAANHAARSLTQDMAGHVANLTAFQTRTESQAAAFPALAVRLADLIDTLRGAADAMPDTAVLTSLADLAVRLPGLGAGLERILQDLPHQVESRSAAQDEVLSQVQQAVAALPVEVVSTVRRLEAACLAADGAGIAMASTAAEVQAAVASVADAAAAIAALQGEPSTTTAAPLRHLDGMERAAAALMREGEVLAEAALAGRAEEIPGSLTERTAEILSAVDTTIHRLRSVATAVAFASDVAASRARAA